MTPELNFCHICENAFLSEENKLNIIGDFDEIKRESGLTEAHLPTPLSFIVVTNFTVPPHKEFVQKVELLNAGGDVLYSSNDIPQVAEKNKIGLLLRVNTMIGESGKFLVRISINGQPVKYMDLTVE